MSSFLKVTNTFCNLQRTLVVIMNWLMNRFTMLLMNFSTSLTSLTLLILVVALSTSFQSCSDVGDPRPVHSIASTLHLPTNCMTPPTKNLKTTPKKCTSSRCKSLKACTGTTKCCSKPTSMKDTASAACHESQGFPGLPLASPSTESENTCKKN